MVEMEMNNKVPIGKEVVEMDNNVVIMDASHFHGDVGGCCHDDKSVVATVSDHEKEEEVEEGAEGDKDAGGKEDTEDDNNVIIMDASHCHGDVGGSCHDDKPVAAAVPDQEKEVEMEEGAEGDEYAGGEEDEDEDGDGHGEVVAWSDVDDEADEGPVVSKNEVKALPLVPPVNATLQPHHEMLPIGVVLSIVGAQVIVEGMEAHNALNEGSILWITQSRLPLGLVDEIFGPVKNPYYVVRYNSESEVPTGISPGTKISYVREFANHIVKDANLYKKGYDASGEHDEEVSSDGEFSDDEKEAEYQRKLKMSKRGSKKGSNRNMAISNNSNKVKGKKWDRKWKDNKPSWQQAPTHESLQPLTSQKKKSQQPLEQKQHNVSSVGTALNTSNCSSSSIRGQDHSSGSSIVPQFLPVTQPTPAFPPPTRVWAHEMPTQQLQNAVLPAGLPINNLPWPAMNQLQQPYQMPLLNILPFQQHFSPSHLPNLLSGSQLNLFSGPTFTPSPEMGLNFFNQNPFGMGLQGQAAPPPMNTMNVAGVANQGSTSNQLFMEPNFNLSPSPAINPGNNQAPLAFNMGAFPSRDNKPHNQHSDHPVRGRGWRPLK